MPPIFILRLSGDRQDVFDEHSGRQDYFAEPVRDFSISGSALVFIVSSSGQLTHVASGGQGRVRAGTGLKRLNLSRIQQLPSRFNNNDLLSHIAPRVRTHAERYLTSGGLPPALTAQALVDALAQLNPAIHTLLQQYRSDRYEYVGGWSEQIRRNLAVQKDALSTALSIADIDRSELREWAPSQQETPRSFLDGLPSVRLREDAMIIRDLHRIPGFENIYEPISGAAYFENPTSRLTVVLANRLPLEELTGTDLIYFNETFRSFVMVQYKAMENETSGPVFRLPNEQLAQEIARMEAIRRALGFHQSSHDADDFRFSENPFFIKLCPRIDLHPGDSDMTKGMYLPLEYWHALEIDPGMIGSAGGRLITYGNVRRYLHNTEFIDLVRKAWIGANSSQSDVLQTLIRDTVESGRAALIAIRSSGTQTIEADRDI